MNPRMNVKLPPELSKRIVDFALTDEGLQYFQKNDLGVQRRYCTLNSFPHLQITQDVKKFAKIAYKQIGVGEFIEEHEFGNFVGVNLTGGNVHPHTDSRHSNGYYHLRLNFLIQKPTIGGNPVIDHIEYEIEEGSSWINYASEWLHSSTPVEGDRYRVVLSLGAYVHPDVVEKITEKLNRTTESVVTSNIDYSRVIRPQEDMYDVMVMQKLKEAQGWKVYEYPETLLKFDGRICVIPQDQRRLNNVLQYNYSDTTQRWKSAYPLGYKNITSLVDIINPHFTNANENISGHIIDTDKYGYYNTWGIISTFGDDPSVVFTNIFHELMHWKLLALGFGTGPNTFFPTTKDFILNDETELCWSIVNSYKDTAQAAVNNKATDRPVSASLHAYVSFLGVAYSYVQFLKKNPNNWVAREKSKLWGSRFDKSFNELLKVGKFTDKGEQLMKGLADWTVDFYKEYSRI
jgi:hypothetical protein